VSKVNQKIAYLEGLVEGLDLPSSSREGRMIHELIDLCKMMAGEMERLHAQVIEQEEYIEAIDEDLSLVEEFFYGDSDVDEDWEEEDQTLVKDDAETTQLESYEDDETGYYEMECPHCDEIIFIDQDLYEPGDQIEVICPECNEVILINDDAPVITSHMMDLENHKGVIHYYAP
jgi:hypothetical protein